MTFVGRPEEVAPLPQLKSTHMGDIGIMEKKMETTIGFRV